MSNKIKYDRLVAIRLPKEADFRMRTIAEREEMKKSEVYRRAIGEFLAEDIASEKFAKLLQEQESHCV
jgi:hypothetical protein